jgi:hypothetical protein
MTVAETAWCLGRALAGHLAQLAPEAEAFRRDAERARRRGFPLLAADLHALARKVETVQRRIREAIGELERDNNGVLRPWARRGAADQPGRAA